MKLFLNPKKELWPIILQRPVCDNGEVEARVRRIIDDVRNGGDAALRRLTEQLDGATLTDFAVTEGEMASVTDRISLDLRRSILLAKDNIEKFHKAQQQVDATQMETMPGVSCWRKAVGIETVGLYVPGGSAPLFSTVLMLCVPAVLAGCRKIILCTPPNSDGTIDDTILFTADLCEITHIYKVGGSQAIAAMAFGTETIPGVDKIFGPGNSYVTTAKQLLSNRVAIDMPAGPSEVAVLADETCEPVFVAADLLSQAEHGPDSQVVLVTTRKSLAETIIREVYRQLQDLPRKEVAAVALSHSRAIVMESVQAGLELLNYYAPEHLILAVRGAELLADNVLNAGSVFIGNYSCESAGDYATGTNHTLPTGGFARSFSGVSLDSFRKFITFQRLSADGIRNIGPAIECMAAAEGLDGHKNAVTVRLEAIGAV